jgi:transketolase
MKLLTKTSLCSYNLQGGHQYYNETPPQPKIKSTTKKTSFSIEKDILLIKIWINTGIDPIQGNDQKASKFWDKILENYKENKKETIVECTTHSLSNKWPSIQKFTNKLCGYLAQVESRNQNGHSEQDNV